MDFSDTFDKFYSQFVCSTSRSGESLVKFNDLNIFSNIHWKRNTYEQLWVLSCRIVLSKPIFWHDDGKANLTIHNAIKHLSDLQCIKNDIISPKDLRHKGFHLNPKGKGRLAVNIQKQSWKFWRSVKQLKKHFLPFDLPHKIDHNILRKSEKLLTKAINEENTYDTRELKHLKNENPYRLIIDDIKKNSK